MRSFFRYSICFLLLASVWLCGAAFSPALAQTTYNPPKNLQPISAASAKQVQVLATIQGSDQGIAAVALAMDRSLVAYGSHGDNHVHLVDVTTGKEIALLKGW